MTDVLRDVPHGCTELSQRRDSWVLYNPHSSLRRSCCSRTGPRAQSVKGGDGLCTQVARLHSTAQGLVILVMRVVRSARASKGFGEADYTPSPNTTNHHHRTQLSTGWQRWGPQGPLQLVPAAGVGPLAGPRTSVGAFPGRLWSHPACVSPQPGRIPTGCHGDRARPGIPEEQLPRNAGHGWRLTLGRWVEAGTAGEGWRDPGGQEVRGASPPGPKNRVGGRPLH